VGAPDREEPDRQNHQERCCQNIHRKSPSVILPTPLSADLTVEAPPKRGIRCGDWHDGGMTPPVIQRWIDIVENGRMSELDDLLADDAVFYSPAVFTPQQGREMTAAYLTAASKLFMATNFRYVEQWFDDRSAVLEFAAEIDGVYVNGVDMIHWNDEQKIISFKVMLRPFKALQTVMPAMSALLQPS
jgi:hypothetical protein